MIFKIILLFVLNVSVLFCASFLVILIIMDNCQNYTFRTEVQTPYTIYADYWLYAEMTRNQSFSKRTK